MDDIKTDQAAEILKTIAHPGRIRILLALAEQPSLNVSALQEQLQIEQSLLSQYLVKMKDRGILVSTRRGQEIHYSLADTSLLEVVKLLLNSR
ncbi:helix-turn-helix transcriptional regulator [Spirosoma sp. KNUC1025]|uniref:ArsR/SmtB family transcription factor n=1 Tax=Spirosoma sp. KNUC1025 TaxID=2894082 RepID=UPI0038630B51|nr:metalloregulator ArsR/SmtB family transcription factor [Spirosoma sp. KNUC1025]